MKAQVVLICGGLLCSFLLQAQRTVEVRDEPFHRPVFQNNRIRLLDVWIGPGDTSLYHIHQLPSIFVFLGESQVVQQTLGSEPAVSHTQAGQTWYRNFKEGPFIHRVYVADSTRLHAIDIELIGQSQAGLSGILSSDVMTLQAEEERSRTYRIQLDPGEDFTLKTLSYPGVLVVYKGTLTKWEKRRKQLPQGTWSWVDAGQKLRLVNTGTLPMEAYLYEIF